jgi:hypothetical protein
MRGMKRRDTDYIFALLEAYGWIKRQISSDVVVWVVNPEVHQLFGPSRLIQMSTPNSECWWPFGEEGVRRLMSREHRLENVRRLIKELKSRVAAEEI